jgi:hypothetical protein
MPDTPTFTTAKYFRVAVFAHKDGWQFVIPGYWVDPDDHDSPGYATLSIDTMMLGIVMNCKATWVDIPVNSDGFADLPYEEGQLIGRQFAHEAIKVMKLTNPLPGVQPYE